MPEGDTVHRAARRVGEALVGAEIVAIETPHPRHALDRWPERLDGRAVRRVEAHHVLVPALSGVRVPGPPARERLP